MSSRDVILGRVRQALRDVSDAAPAADVPVDWSFGGQRITTELAEHDRQNLVRPSAPFAVNQIVHKTNERLHEDMALCVKYKVHLVITSLGAQTEINDAVHSYGGLVMHDVINQKFAHKAIEKGAYDFYQKPVDPEVLGLIVDRAYNLFELEDENRRLARKERPSPLAGIIAASGEMTRVCRMVEKVAPTSATV